MKAAPANGQTPALARPVTPAPRGSSRHPLPHSRRDAKQTPPDRRALRPGPADHAYDALRRRTNRTPRLVVPDARARRYDSEVSPRSRHGSPPAWYWLFPLPRRPGGTSHGATHKPLLPGAGNRVRVEWKLDRTTVPEDEEFNATLVITGAPIRATSFLPISANWRHSNRASSSLNSPIRLPPRTRRKSDSPTGSGRETERWIGCPRFSSITTTRPQPPTANSPKRRPARCASWSPRAPQGGSAADAPG